MKINVGIDLGTTYSCVATFDKAKGMPIVLKNSMNEYTTPSAVLIENGVVKIGQEAKDEISMGNYNAITCFKTFMGDPCYIVNLDGKDYTSEDLSTIFLKHLIKDIETTNNVEIDKVVITMPAYFGQAQKFATLNAGRRAGLNVIRTINEPTAAIIAYGLNETENKSVMVYDLGGGTFDVTIGEVKDHQILILSSNGDHQLGGKDWDHALYMDIIERFSYEYGIEITDFPDVAGELLVDIEKAKKKLTQLDKTTITVSCDGCVGRYEITREWFNDITSDLLNRTQLLTEQCFNDLGEQFSWNTIDEIVLVGGSTRMPQVRNLITSLTNKTPITSVDPDTIVACGAAIQAEILSEKTLTFSLGKTYNANPTQKHTFTLNANSVQDVTPHGLGMLAKSVDTNEYINSIIIPKNSKLNKKFQKQYTFKGSQLDVYVLEGETKNIYDTTIIGKYKVTGIDPNKISVINMNYLYDSNSIVQVEAFTDKNVILTVEKENINSSIAELVNDLDKQQSASNDLEIIMMIDSSSSMKNEPITKAKEAAIEFVNEFDLSHTKISIVEFADKCNFNCKASSNYNEIINAINSINPGHNVGTGNLTTPINKNYQEFNEDTSKILIVLTDGRWVHQESEMKKAILAKSLGVTIYAIGFGEADEEFLEKVSSDNSSKKVDLSQLKTAFKEVASNIATEMASRRLG